MRIKFVTPNDERILIWDDRPLPRVTEWVEHDGREWEVSRVLHKTEEPYWADEYGTRYGVIVYLEPV